MAINDVYRFTIHAVSQAQNIQNTFYFRRKVAGEPSQAACQAVADDCKTAARTATIDDHTWVDWTAVQWAGAGVTWPSSLCRPQGGQQFSAALSAPLTGPVVATDALPPKDCLVVSLRSGLTGRRRRGRLYLCGYTANSQVGGTWTAAHLTAVAAGVNALAVEYGPTGTDSDWQWVIFSDRIASGCVPVTPPAKGMINVETPNPADAWRGVSTLLYQTPVFSQRRRTIGVGR